MNVLIVDESSQRRDKIVKMAEGKKHSVMPCSVSNDFISALQQKRVDKILLDLTTWREGKSIYSYFGIPKKLEKTPILFYNAPEGFTVLGDREANEEDRVLPLTLDAESLLNSIQQEL